jgi:hypothetical protein
VVRQRPHLRARPRGNLAPDRHHPPRAGRSAPRDRARARDRAEPARPMDQTTVRDGRRPGARRAHPVGAARDRPRRALLDVRVRGWNHAPGVPPAPRHLRRLRDLAPPSGEPSGGRRLRSARSDGASRRRPLGHVLHGHRANRRGPLRRGRHRVHRPRALGGPQRRLHRRMRGHRRWPPHTCFATTTPTPGR